MYNFLLLQYRLGKIGEPELEIAVTEGWITDTERATILEAGPAKTSSSH